MTMTTHGVSSVGRYLASWSDLGKDLPTRFDVSNFKSKEVIENSEVLVF